jgi:predicted Zn-ribbon and HTH transcriptional regulator
MALTVGRIIMGPNAPFDSVGCRRTVERCILSLHAETSLGCTRSVPIKEEAMKRPTLEVADIIRSAGKSFIERNRSHLGWQQLKVLRAIERCRTAALGGHLDRCTQCGYRTISFHSCRNRHCPKCQTNARNQWLAAPQQELLPVSYWHVVFTLPHELATLALQNKKAIYNLLFQASAATLLEVAADPAHLGAESGFLSVLHTCGQNLQAHPHVHCVVPAGGLSPDHLHWTDARTSFLLPVKVLSRVFRGKFVSGLKRLFRQHKLSFLRHSAAVVRFQSLLRVPAPTVPAGLDRLRQTPIRWTRARTALPGSLHPSRRHLKSQTRIFYRRPSHVSLEGLRQRQ